MIHTESHLISPGQQPRVQSCTWGMIHIQIHLIIPGYPSPSVAFQGGQNCGLKPLFYHSFTFCVVATLTFVNGLSVEWAARVQNIFSVIKIVALICIIITGIYVMATGKRGSRLGAIIMLEDCDLIGHWIRH